MLPWIRICKGCIVLNFLLRNKNGMQVIKFKNVALPPQTSNFEMDISGDLTSEVIWRLSVVASVVNK